MVKAVIFDIDGTLVDSVNLHAHAWQQAFQQFGHNVTFEEVRQQIGKGSDKLIPHFLYERENERLGKQLDKFRSELWKREYLPKVQPFPMVRELFERLLAESKKVVLASSAKGDELEAYKKIAGINDLIQRETSSDDVENSKPDPDIIHAALAKLHNPDPSEVIMIGDTPYDAISADKAGVRTIGVLCGGWSEEQLREAGCVAVYRDPSDLLLHYARSPLASPTGIAA
ncbi:MAG TPA: HAD family hydrolase [Terriglobales bacterium]|nr:HAD family hydrolase [Terriglobales bacterium]